ncbi:Srl1p LALA0_S01e04060g [Lachancea lanzarotensis]|uniref:LALA0S01e04060g1_1 n=1 Tax=Lachancea lanzarotensis TaxID=1245769 RepID=A0A0C7N3U4_9SACH|nr:uncharacterized protein LALA0_S01e04060g [Lachancea lanzarotensis]CEP60146.1 LALA0S01e04060g1_1 [Lachancea lanzarotensis]
MKFSTLIPAVLAASGLTSAIGYSNLTTTTLAPSSKAVLTTETTEFTSNGNDYTSTVTLLTTITLSNSAASASASTPALASASASGAAGVSVSVNGNAKDANALLTTSSETEIWSTITSTLYTTQSVTMSNSQVSLSTSAYEKQIVVGTSNPACVPQTVTVTQDQTHTQYVTVTASGPAASSSAYTWAPASASIYNGTSTAR